MILILEEMKVLKEELQAERQKSNSMHVEKLTADRRAAEVTALKGKIEVHT